MEWVVITFGGEKRSEGSNFVEWYIGSVPNQSDGDVAGRHMQLDKSCGISLLIFSNFRSIQNLAMMYQDKKQRALNTTSQNS